MIHSASYQFKQMYYEFQSSLSPLSPRLPTVISIFYTYHGKTTTAEAAAAEKRPKRTDSPEL